MPSLGNVDLCGVNCSTFNTPNHEEPFWLTRMLGASVALFGWAALPASIER